MLGGKDNVGKHRVGKHRQFGVDESITIHGGYDRDFDIEKTLDERVSFTVDPIPKRDGSHRAQFIRRRISGADVLKKHITRASEDQNAIICIMANRAQGLNEFAVHAGGPEIPDCRSAVPMNSHLQHVAFAV